MNEAVYTGLLLLSCFFREKAGETSGEEDYFQEFPFLFPEADRDMFLEQYRRFRGQWEGADTPAARRIWPLFENNFLAQCSFCLAAAEYYIPVLGYAAEKITGMRGITIELSYVMLFGEDFTLHLEEIEKAYHALAFLFGGTLHTREPFRTFLKMDYGFLQCVCKEEAPAAKKQKRSPVLFQRKKEQAITEIRNLQKLGSSRIAVLIRGSAQSGRKTSAAYLAESLGKGIKIIDVQQLFQQEEDPEKEARYRIRDAFLKNELVALEHIRLEADGVQGFYYRILERLEFCESPYFLLLEENHTEELPKCDCVELTLTACCKEERESLWRQCLRQHYKASEADRLAALAQPLLMPPGLVCKTVRRLAAGGNPPEEEKLFQCYYQLYRPEAGGGVQLLEPVYSISQVLLPKRQKRLLEEVCSQVRYRAVVYESWKASEIYGYGTGISVLFTGPPGTGKTMAAHGIAKKLNRILLKADLSQIADKYIGETEKKLQAIFELAENSNGVLFFDEADSLFGKRSEIKDSHDRHANLQTSYILQRIEEYKGIVVLATNYSVNIDSAFLRRMRFVIEFPLPDKKTRKNLWESLLLESVPKEEIDTEFLAEQFELAGAGIKNVMLNAMFQAAAKEEALNMAHILQSVQDEYLKTGRLLGRFELGKYGVLLEKEEEE